MLTLLARRRRSFSIYPASQHRISTALNYTPEVMVTVFGLDGRSLTTPVPPNGLDTQRSHGHGRREEEDEFPSLDELLGVGGAQGSQRGGSIGYHGTGRSDGVFECSAKPDCNSAPTPLSRRYGNDGGDSDSRSRVHTSDSSTSKGQDGTQGLLSTPRTSVAGSEAG